MRIGRIRHKNAPPFTPKQMQEYAVSIAESGKPMTEDEIMRAIYGPDAIIAPTSDAR